MREPLAPAYERFSSKDREQLKAILAQPVEFLPHPSFAQAKTARTLFGKGLDEQGFTRAWCNAATPEGLTDISTLPTNTLSGSEEQKLFLQLNYARYRIGGILNQFANKRLTVKAASEILWWHGQVVTARCKIVQANVPLVLAMAKRTRMNNADYAELISEGNMALLRSVDKFDCGRGFKFSTYACRAILKSFSRVAMRAGRYRGRFPAEFDPTLEKSDYMERYREGVEADCVDELKHMLRTNRADLNDVEYRVITARFALDQPNNSPDATAPKTLEQVGLMIGVTKERVRQIQNRALEKLREKMENDFLAA